MLELRPNCECCDADLSPSDPGAMICSFECTYCTACAAGVLRGRCPNCGGGLAPRPLRAPEKLRADPASTTRVRRSTPCAPRSTTALRAFASYSPRQVRFERIERRAEWSLKVYRMSAGKISDGPSAAAVLHAGVETALAHLLSPRRRAHVGGIEWGEVPEHGVGFVQIHEGRDGVYTVLDVWFGEAMLRHAVWIASLAAPTEFQSAEATGLGVCVWELAVLEHERRAWLRHVLTPEGRGDIEGYLADVIDGFV